MSEMDSLRTSSLLGTLRVYDGITISFISLFSLRTLSLSCFAQLSVLTTQLVSNIKTKIPHLESRKVICEPELQSKL